MNAVRGATADTADVNLPKLIRAGATFLKVPLAVYVTMTAFVFALGWTVFFFAFAALCLLRVLALVQKENLYDAEKRVATLGLASAVCVFVYYASVFASTESSLPAAIVETGEVSLAS